MRKLITLISLVTVCSSWAALGHTNRLQSFSPKLRQFLAGHAAADQILLGAVLSLSNRTVQVTSLVVTYFYTDDENTPRSSSYSAGPNVSISIRENQEPCDEYLSLLFHVFKAQRGDRFKVLTDQAKSGDLSKDDFVKEALREQFHCIVKLRGLFDELQLTTKEKESSYCYREFGKYPKDFEEFFAGMELDRSRGNLLSLEEGWYETLRKTQ